MPIAVILGAVIGLLLGVLGGGGSIVTVPVLVYGAGVPGPDAVTMSLAVIGGASVVGAVFKHRHGLIHRQAAVTFSGAGVVGAMGGSQLTWLVSPTVLLLSFAILMLIVATSMLRWESPERLHPVGDCRPLRCMTAGLGVGALTGFLGIGGGFLIVPTMVKFGHIPLKMAAGTSLVVIAVNSVSGLIGHWSQSNIDWPLTLTFLAFAIAGMLAGLPLAERLPARKLSRLFAWIVIVTALFVIGKNAAEALSSP